MNRRAFMVGLGALGLTRLVRPSEVLGASKGPVIIEAGRRIDAPNADVARFPAANVPLVQKRIRKELRKQHPTAVVCSAACGADLLLLDAAREMQIKQIVLLPADPESFRKSSVTDRPGNWGEIYDRVLKTATVEILQLPEGQEGYLETNLKLLDRGQQLAARGGVAAEALVIWNGKSRGPDDVTAHFLLEAQQRKIATVQIYTV